MALPPASRTSALEASVLAANKEARRTDDKPHASDRCVNSSEHDLSATPIVFYGLHHAFVHLKIEITKWMEKSLSLKQIETAWPEIGNFQRKTKAIPISDW